MPGGVQGLDRYAYINNNPTNYVDPNGHTPAWWDQIMGGIAQYFNDITFGVWSAVAGDLDLVVNEAFQEGRATGRAVSTAQSVFEAVEGTAMATTGASALAPTAAGGGACALATGGACAVPALAGLTVESGMIIGGTLEAVHGVSIISYIKNNPLGKSGNLSGIFQRGGNTLNKQTLDALGLTKEQGKFAIEDMKKDLGLPNDFHGYIMKNGDIINPKTGDVVGNILNYVP